MFKKGDRIVCVEEFTGNYLGTTIPTGTSKPKKDKFYICDGMATDMSLYLRGFNELNMFGSRSHFNAAKFRKAEDNFGEQVLKNITEQIKEEELEHV